MYPLNTRSENQQTVGRIELQDKPLYLSRREIGIGLAGIAVGGFVGGLIGANLMHAYDLDNIQELIMERLFGSGAFIATPQIGENPQYGDLENQLVKGSKSPDFELKGLDGKIYKLSDYKGKPVVINFWESRCVYCVEEMPSIREFAAAYKDRVHVLTITQDQSRNTREFLKQNGLESLTVLLDADKTTYRLYEIATIPTTYVADETGKIAHIEYGQAEFMNPEAPIRKTVDSLLPKGQIPKTETGPKRPARRNVIKMIFRA